MPEPVRICFVCSGNICRSPTAEVVLTQLVNDAGLATSVVVGSAGTGSWHAGDDMDERSRRALTAAGYRVPRHVARQFRADHFADNDLVLALDAEHVAALRALADRTPDPDSARGKIRLLREFDPDCAPGADLDVPDPYYGGASGFRTVLDQVERSCAGLLAALQRSLVGGSADRQPTPVTLDEGLNPIQP
jgi:low molecular weight protein-tyrosine phosphatase